MKCMENINELKQLAPVHVQDLYAAYELVCNELNAIKEIVDEQIKIKMSNNEFDEARRLIEVSSGLFEKYSEISKMIEENDEENIECSEDELIEQMERDSIDYESYSVDNTIAYDLFIPVTFKKPCAFSFKGEKYTTSSWAYMLKQICEILYAVDPLLFKSFCSDKTMNGKKKSKFSENKELIRKPVKLKNSSIYIETNLSANDIRKEILKMLDKYNISSDAVKIYISRDYSELHNH